MTGTRDGQRGPDGRGDANATGDGRGGGERPEDAGRSGRGGRWAAASGLAAVVGGLVWVVTPWVQRAVLGDRPYVASGFDAASLAGWLLMAAGLVGVRAVFGSGYGRLGRAALRTTAVGMVLAALPTARSVAVFAAAGFRAVPAVGEGPAGLLLTWTTLFGLGLTVVGAGGLGVALRRVADPPRAAVVLLSAAAAVPLLVVGLRLRSLLPLSVGRLVVSTDAALLPLGVGWVALGAAVRSRAADTGGRTERRTER